jgi:hypothetical protein
MIKGMLEGKQIGEFLERKECNAEGKTPACQKKTSFISAKFYTIFTKKYTTSSCNWTFLLTLLL